MKKVNFLKCEGKQGTKSFLSGMMLAVFLLTGLTANAQNRQLTGTVTDAATEEPLAGASVVVKGTTQGAVTDMDGNFSIEAPGNAVLAISYIGYIPVEEPVNGRTSLNIRLREDSKSLDEVVVIGYGIQKKSDVTGAISQVKAEDMMNRTITRPEEALQGKTAGVQIVQISGAPGSSPDVRVRGYSSNVSSSPLFVVDGIRTNNIGGLDPNDIATMEVLKDAASAAIYGSEAGNGMILITTKKGQKGAAKISYDFQLSSQSLARIPKVLNAQEYINYMSEGNLFLLADMQAKWDGKTDTKWSDIAFENSLMTKHNLAFQGGNDRGGYYLSLSYLDNDGIVKGNKDRYERLTATVNADYKIKDWLKIGTTNQVERYSIRAIPEKDAEGNTEYGSLLTGVLQLDPLTPDVYDANNLPAYMRQILDDGHTLLTNGAGQYYGISQFLVSELFHPMIMRDKTTEKNSGFNVNGSIFADLTPVKDLTVTSRLGYRLSGARSSTYDHPYYGSSGHFDDFADLSSQSSTTIYYQWENFVNWSKTIGLHTVSAMAGMSYQENSYDYVEGGLTGNGESGILKDDPLFAYLNYPSSTALIRTEGEETKTSKLSYFGRLGYAFSDKYLLQASLRADATDLAYLPANNRWGYFPAVSAGWIVSNEEFFKSPDNPVYFMKLRASWGQNGSLAALGGYLYGTSITGGTGGDLYPMFSPYAFYPASYPVSMGNNEVKWETSEQTDIGLDLRFFHDKLTFGFDWFNKRTKDLLINGTTPSLTVGGTVSPINAGNVKNTGIEFEMGWTDRIGDFSYGVRANLATVKNEVTYLDKSLSRIIGSKIHLTPITYFEQGYPVYYFRGYQFDHINDADGEPVFKDLNEDGIINDEDQTSIGDAIPDLTYGLTLTAAWKGFDLTVFGTGAQGNDIFGAFSRSDKPESSRLKEVFYDGRWTSPGGNASKPRSGADGMAKYFTSDAMVFDGSYFKIKQIQLGYSLPKQLLRKAYIEGLRVYVSLDDFFTFSSYPGFDPEVASSAAGNARTGNSGMGVDKGVYPTSKKIVCGLNITF